MKISNKPQPHNDPTLSHKDKMLLRKRFRRERTRVIQADSPFAKLLGSGKYIPKLEDKKHLTTPEVNDII